MKIAYRVLVFVSALMFMFGVDFVVETSPEVSFVKEAQAIVGAPRTPVSAAGVARRTTRRVVATRAVATGAAVATTTAAVASAPPPSTVVVVTSPSSSVPIGTVVQSLPSGCTTVVANGVSYSSCAGAYYRAATQGNNLVYIVVEKPIK